MSHSARRALVPCALMTIVIMVMLVTPARAALGSVSADWPAAKLSRGSTVSVTGRVSGQAPGDGVFLQQKVLGGWRNITKDALDSQRNYRLPIPTWWLGQRSYRVVSTDLQDTTTLGTASGTWTVEIVPTYNAPGLESQFHYSTSTYARWDPCRTIGYRVNARQATSGALADVKGAFQRLSQATGFHFVYRGTTTGIPQNGGNSWYPAGTQIVVAWARPAQSSMLRLYANAVAVGSAITSGGYANGDGSSVSRIIRGAVVVNSNKRLPRRVRHRQHPRRHRAARARPHHGAGTRQLDQADHVPPDHQRAGPARRGRPQRTRAPRRQAGLRQASAVPQSATLRRHRDALSPPTSSSE